MAPLLRYISAVIIAFAVSAVIALTTSSAFFPITFAKINIELGGAIFKGRCSGCHSVTTGVYGKMGPNLGHIGVEGAMRKPGMSAPEYILESILDPDAFTPPGVDAHMPTDTFSLIDERNMRDLIAFLASRGKSPDIQEILAMDIVYPIIATNASRNRSVILIEHGADLFLNTLGCVECHSIYPEPGHDFVAPSLNKASQLSKEYIIESIREPSKFISPGYKQVVVKLKSGKIVGGRLLDKNIGSILIFTKDVAGHYIRVEIESADILSVTPEHVSMMPSYQLSALDQMAIVAFLKSIVSHR